MVEGSPVKCFSCQNDFKQKIINSRKLHFVCICCGLQIIMVCNETLPFAVKVIAAAKASV